MDVDQQSTPEPTSGLYQRLMGLAWNDLHVNVQRMHDCETIVRGEGAFRVSHGDHVLARLLAWLLRLPAETANCRVYLEIARHDGTERWLRIFGGRKLLTTQWEGPDRLLVERVGMLEWRFRVDVNHGALIYHQRAFGLYFGRWRLPVPPYIAPQVQALEAPSQLPYQASVVVTVSTPLLGMLLTYQGKIRLTR